MFYISTLLNVNNYLFMSATGGDVKMTNPTKHKQNKTKQEYGFVFVFVLLNCMDRP